MMILQLRVAFTFKVSILDVWWPIVNSMFVVSLPEIGITDISPYIGV